MPKVAPKKNTSQEDFPPRELAYLNDHVPIQDVYAALTGLAVDEHWVKCPLTQNHQNETETSVLFSRNRAECIEDRCDGSFSVVTLVEAIRGCDTQDAVQWIRAKFPGPVPVEQDDDDDPVAADAPRPLVPPGEYDVQCTRAVRRLFPAFNRPVIVLTLRICSAPHMGVVIERFFNVPEDGKIHRGSHYFAEWIMANGNVQPHRRDKMARRKFVGKLFRARVVTVSTDRNRVALGAASYSKAARLIALVATNEWP